MRRFANHGRSRDKRKFKKEPIIDIKKAAAPLVLISFFGCATDWPRILRRDIPFDVNAAYSKEERGPSLEKIEAGFRVRVLKHKFHNIFIKAEYDYADRFVEYLHRDEKHTTRLQSHLGLVGLETVQIPHRYLRLGVTLLGYGGAVIDKMERKSDGAESEALNFSGLGVHVRAALGLADKLLLAGGWSTDTSRQGFAKMIVSAIPSWVENETVNLVFDYERRNFIKGDFSLDPQDTLKGYFRIPIFETDEFGMDLIPFTEWEMGTKDMSRHGGEVSLVVGPVELRAGADHHGNIRFLLGLMSDDVEGNVRIYEVEGSRDVKGKITGGTSEGEPWWPEKEEDVLEVPDIDDIEISVGGGDFDEDLGSSPMEYVESEIRLRALRRASKKSWMIPPVYVTGIGLPGVDDVKKDVEINGTRYTIRINRDYMGDGERGKEGWLYSESSLVDFDRNNDGVLSVRDIEDALDADCGDCLVSVNRILGDMNLERFSKWYRGGIQIALPLERAVREISEEMALSDVYGNLVE